MGLCELGDQRWIQGMHKEEGLTPLQKDVLKECGRQVHATGEPFMCPPTFDNVKGPIKVAASEFLDFAEPKLPRNYWEEEVGYFEYAIATWPPPRPEGKLMSTRVSLLLGLIDVTLRAIRFSNSMLTTLYSLLSTTPGCLMAAPVVYDYIFGEEDSMGQFWTNTVKDPVQDYYKGMTADVAYEPPKDKKTLTKADLFLCQALHLFAVQADQRVQDKKVCGLIQVDAQNFMYTHKNRRPLLEVQNVVQTAGFKFGKTILGGELIVYHRGKLCAYHPLQPCLFLTHHHHTMSPGQFLLKAVSSSYYMVTGL